MRGLCVIGTEWSVYGSQAGSRQAGRQAGSVYGKQCAARRWRVSRSRGALGRVPVGMGARASGVEVYLQQFEGV